MNIVDRAFMSSILCAIWYHIEKCSVIEYIASVMLLTSAWILLGAFEDRDKQNGKWSLLSEFILKQIQKKVNDLLVFIDEVITNDKEKATYICTAICSILDSGVLSDDWDIALDNVRDALVKIELTRTIKKGEKNYLKKIRKR